MTKPKRSQRRKHSRIRLSSSKQNIDRDAETSSRRSFLHVAGAAAAGTWIVSAPLRFVGSASASNSSACVSSVLDARSAPSDHDHGSDRSTADALATDTSNENQLANNRKHWPISPEALPQGLPLRDWFVERVHPLHYGAVPIVLVHPSGARAQVDALRLRADLRGEPSSGIQGIAQTKMFRLFLANGGNGAQPTHESSGLAVMFLAEVLKRIESRAPECVDVNSLLSFEERQTRFPRAKFRIV